MMVGVWGVSAQELCGVVYDEAGEPLPYATVKVKSIDGSKVLTGGVTRDDGSFTLDRKSVV